MVVVRVCSIIKKRAASRSGRTHIVPMSIETVALVLQAHSGESAAPFPICMCGCRSLAFLFRGTMGTTETVVVRRQYWQRRIHPINGDLNHQESVVSRNEGSGWIIGAPTCDEI